jgi:hypothetical protein
MFMMAYNVVSTNSHPLRIVYTVLQDLFHKKTFFKLRKFLEIITIQLYSFHPVRQVIYNI